MSDTNPTVGIRLNLDGAPQVQAGITAVSGSLDKLDAALAGISANNKALDSLAGPLGNIASSSKLSSDALQQILDKLTGLGAAGKAGASGLKTFQEQQSGVTAATKLSTYHTAQLSAQLQDLFVQIQAGGSPMTALIQQGSQLSAVFGGFGPALKAIASLVTPTVIGLGSLAAVAGTLGIAFLSGRNESSAFRRDMALTGNAAGLTAGAYEDMAKRIAASTSSGIGTARKALAELVASGRLSGDALQSTATATAALSRATGQDASDIAKQFVSLTDNVASGVVKLNQQYHFLTAAQYQEIKALEDQGRAQEAITIAMTAFEGRVGTTVQTLGTLERAWQKTKNAASGFWDSLKDIGRDTTVADQIAALQTKIAAARGGTVGDREAIPALQAQLASLQEIARVMDSIAQKARARADSEQAGIQFLQLQEKSLTSQQQLAQSLQEIYTKGKAAGISDDQIAALQARVTKGSAALGEAVAAQYARIDAAALASTARLSAAYEALQTKIDTLQVSEIEGIKQAGAIRLQQIEVERSALAQRAAVTQNDAERISLNGQLVAKNIEIRNAERAAIDAVTVAIYKQVTAAEALAKAYDDQVQAEINVLRTRADADQKRIADATTDYVRQLGFENDQLKLEASLMASTNEQRDIAIAKLKIQQDLEKKIADIKKLDGFTSEETKQQLIDNAKAAAEQASAQVTTKIQQDAYGKLFVDIRSGLYDAIFHGGSDGWTKLRTTIENQVIRPVIEAQLNQVTQSIIAAIRGGSSSGSAGGLNGNSLGGLGSLWDTFSTSSIGQKFGLSSLTEDGAGNMWVQQGTSSSAVGQYAQNAGAALAYVSAAVAASKGQWGNALGTAVGTYFFGPIGGAIGSAVGSMVDKFAAGKSGTPHQGSVVTVDSKGLAVTGGSDPSRILDHFSESTDNALKTLLSASVGSLNSLATAFGSAANFTAQGKFAADNTTASFGGLDLLRAGASVSQITRPGGDAKAYDKDPAKAFEAYTKDVVETVKATINQIELPQWATDAIAKLTAADGIDGLATVVQQIVQTETAIAGLKQAFEPLGGIFSKIGGLSGDAILSLAKIAGGIDALSGNLSSYFDNFYSDGERASMTLDAVGKTLASVGIDAVPKTREAYRKLVEAQDLTTQSGLETTAALLKVAGAFADAVPVAEDMTKVLQERAGLETQLLQLQGNVAAIRATERAALDESNRAIYDQVKALEDQKAAADAAKEALKKLTDDLKTLISSLRDAAAQALAGVERAIQAQKDLLTAAYDSAVAKLDAQATTAKDAYSALSKDLDAQRIAAKAIYDAQASAIRSAQSDLDARISAQAKTYDAAAKAISAERDAAQKAYKSSADALTATIKAQTDAVSKIRGLTDSLKQTLQSLRPIGSEGLDRTRAQQQIAQALAVARAGGALPAADDLRNALSVVAKPSEELFGSFEDYLRDFYRTSVDISDLNTIAGQQLDSVQTQLDATIAVKDALDSANEANLARLDAMKEALDTANDLAREQFAMERDRLSGQLTAARDRYDATVSSLDAKGSNAKDALDALLESIDNQKLALKEAYDKQIKALDDLLKVATQQYNAVVGIDDSVRSIADAMSNLGSALAALAAATGKPVPNGGATTPTGQWVTAGSVQTYADASGAVAIKTTEQKPADAIVQGVDKSLFTVGDISAFVADHLASGDLAGVIAKAKQVGVSSSSIDDAMGWTRGTWDAISAGGKLKGYTAEEIRGFIQASLSANDPKSVYDKAIELGIGSKSLDAIMGWKDGTALDWAVKNGLPAFAAGGTFGGGLALVGERGPEVVATGPARVFSFAEIMAGQRGNNDQVVQELQALRDEVAQLRADSNAGLQATAANTSKTARQFERWDVDGLPETRTV